MCLGLFKCGSGLFRVVSKYLRMSSCCVIAISMCSGLFRVAYSCLVLFYCGFVLFCCCFNAA